MTAVSATGSTLTTRTTSASSSARPGPASVPSSRMSTRSVPFHTGAGVAAGLADGSTDPTGSDDRRRIGDEHLLERCLELEDHDRHPGVHRDRRDQQAGDGQHRRPPLPGLLPPPAVQPGLHDRHAPPREEGAVDDEQGGKGPAVENRRPVGGPPNDEDHDQRDRGKGEDRRGQPPPRVGLPRAGKHEREQRGQPRPMRCVAREVLLGCVAHRSGRV